MKEKKVLKKINILLKRHCPQVLSIFNKTKSLDSLVENYKNEARDIAMPSQAYLNWGNYFSQLGLDDVAIEKFEQCAAMPNVNPEAYTNIGIIENKKGNFEKAQEAFKKAIRLDCRNARAYAHLACSYCESKNFDYADKMFKKAEKFTPYDHTIFFDYALALSKMGRKGEAIEFFEKSYVLNPTNMQTLYYLSVALIDINMHQEALLRLSIIEKMDPFHMNLNWLLAVCYHALGDAEKAIEYSKKALGTNPKNLECHIILAQCYYVIGERELCLAQYKKAEEAKCVSGSFYYSWGRTLQAYKMWEESIPKFLIAIEYEENVIECYQCLSASYLKAGDLEKTKEITEKILEIDPCDCGALYNLGQVYTAQQKYEEANNYLKKAIKICPDFINAYTEIAENYTFLNDEKSAIKTYEKALEYAPDNKDVKIALTQLYINTGDNQNGIRKARALYTEDKEDPQTAFLYGVLLAKQQEYYKAIEILEKVCTHNPDNHAAIFMKAECLSSVGKPREALALIAPYEESDGETFAFLLAKINCYQKLIADDENNTHLIDTIKDICDKIISLYPSETWVLDIKSKLDNNRN